MTFGPHRWRRLTPTQEAEAARLLLLGVKPAVVAERFGVSPRTAQRIRVRQLLPFVVVECGPYRAEFSLTDDGPVQRTGWVAA